MSPNRAANAPACPNRAKTRGSVVHAQATAASGTATNPRTYDELVASKSGNLRRLYTIVCVIILEILQRMAMMDNPALKPLPSTVLARAIAGDNFGLPAPLAATLRLLAREIQRWIEPAAPNSEAPEPEAQSQAPSADPSPQPHPHTAPTRSNPRLPAPSRAFPRPPTTRPAPAPAPPLHPPRLRPPTPLSKFFQNPNPPPHPRTPISFRIRNIQSTLKRCLSPRHCHSGPRMT